MTDASRRDDHAPSASTAPKPFVFVLMPFDAAFKDVYTFGIKAAAHEVGAYCERVDEQNFDEGILDRVFNQISKADVIVADMSGKNPNVFYEVGYAHALDKVVILLTKNVVDIPFDLKHRPHIVYDGSIERLRELLPDRVRWAIAESKQRSQRSGGQQVTLLVDGVKIPQSGAAGAVPTIRRAIGTDDPVFSLSVALQNDALEAASDLSHVYLSTEADRLLIPARAKDSDAYEPLEPLRLRSEGSFPVQYRLTDRVPSIPYGAIEELRVPLMFPAVKASAECALSIRVHLPSGYRDYDFKLAVAREFEGRTLVEWQAHFESASGPERKAAFDAIATFGRSAATVIVRTYLRDADPETRQLARNRVPGTDDFRRQPAFGAALQAAFPPVESADDPGPIILLLARMSLPVARVSAILGPTSLPRFIAALEDPHADVRVAAATLLGAARPRTDAIATALIGALADIDSNVRKAAIQALEVGTPSSDAVTAALADVLTSDKNQVVRVAAAGALSRLETLSAVGLPALIESLKDGVYPVQECALKAIQRLGPQGAPAVPVLIELLRAGSSSLSEETANALAAIGPAAAPAVEELLRIAKSKSAVSASAPTAAVRALGRVGESSDIVMTGLIEVLKGGIVAAREATAAVLAAFGPAAAPAIPELVKMLKRSDDSDGLAFRGWSPARTALAAIGRAAVPALISELHTEGGDANRIAGALGAIGEPAVPALIDKLETSDSKIQILVAGVLGTIGPAAGAAIPALTRVQEGTLFEVRAAARRALAQIKTDARSS